MIDTKIYFIITMTEKVSINGNRHMKKKLQYNEKENVNNFILKVFFIPTVELI